MAKPRTKSTGLRKRTWVLLMTVAVLVIISPCLGLAGCLSWENSAEGDLKRPLDALALPPEIHVVSDNRQGNVLCLDQCLEISRLYSSSLSKEDTFRIFKAQLQGMGYQCGVCDGFGPTELGLPTKWQGSPKQPEISLVVFSTTDAQRFGYYSDSHLDRTSPTHVLVSPAFPR